VVLSVTSLLSLAVTPMRRAMIQSHRIARARVLELLMIIAQTRKMRENNMTDTIASRVTRVIGGSVHALLDAVEK